MKYGLIGNPLKHSFSKVIHEQIGEYDYTLLELQEEEFDLFFSERSFHAINVTIPYKERVIPYLDYVSDEVKAIGACNTIVNKNGKLYGYNTDYYGLKELIETQGIAIAGKSVLILGTGGTSKTALKLMKDMGAAKCLRATRRAEEGIGMINYSKISSEYPDFQVVINTTPAGMYPHLEDTPLDIENYNHLEAVVDVVYNPLRTSMTLAAAKRGLKWANGLYMLVSQAIYANALFMGHEPYRNKTAEIHNYLRKEKENICLIGMPSCGKTTIGKMVAERLNADFYDTDQMIVERIGMSIPDYFQQFGEEAFRDRESEVIAALAGKTSSVIATGGGAILRKKNVENLKHNSRILFLDRALEKLTPTSDRPLTQDFAALKRKFDERRPIYLASCDAIIDCNDDDNYEQVIGDILKS
ncbi:MAG: hypothetical protein HUJ90_05315 [Bacteroidales bacterium]|nr:hypothetical protein [Bacteroidales bacterium]